MSWTTGNISNLTLEQLKNLTANARRLGSTEVLAMCEAELIARKPPPKSVRVKPIGFSRVTRSHGARQLEKSLEKRLLEVARLLDSKYDLSMEKAYALSIGTKKFQPHSLLSSKGKAKVGGAQRAGYVVFDRYISYRLKDSIFALIVLLDDPIDLSKVQYQVIGPSDMLTKAKPISELRSYLDKGESIGLSDFAENYETFDEAAECFLSLMGKIAPKRNN